MTTIIQNKDSLLNIQTCLIDLHVEIAEGGQVVANQKGEKEENLIWAIGTALQPSAQSLDFMWGLGWRKEESGCLWHSLQPEEQKYSVSIHAGVGIMN